MPNATRPTAPSKNFFIVSLSSFSSLRLIQEAFENSGVTAVAIQTSLRATYPSSGENAVSEMQHSRAK
jgi:hypothetical protein